MKTITHILKRLVPFLLLFTWTGCNNDHNDGPVTEPEYLDISTLISRNGERLTGNNFEIGDTIGIYVVEYDETNTNVDEISNGAAVVNEPYIYNGSGWYLPSGSKIPWPDRDRSNDIYAYYPYDEVMSQQDPTAYRFTVQTDQTTLDDYYASDFVWAKRADVLPTRENVQLTFFHRMTKVNVHIRSDLEEVRQTLDQATVTLYPETIDAEVNLSDGGVLAVVTNGPVEMLPYMWQEPLTDYDISLEAILVPQNIPSGSEFIVIEHNETLYYYRPSSTIAMVGGSTVNFYITIDRMGITVTVNSINEWMAGPDTDGTIGDPAPRVVDVSTLDWSVSRVYNVLDNGVLIAQVCREYLFRTGTVNNQAIVVYPIDTDGKPDLTNGFVAQVMNRTINSNTLDYDPLTTDVHGGSVSFASANTLTSYTAGTSSLVNKVAIVSSDQIVSASDNSIALLTTEPYRMTDIDGNSYSVVKIAHNFWMAENLTVERYNDGSPLTAYYFNDDPATYKSLFGAYYTYPTVVNPSGIAPAGWHVPSYDEMSGLYTYLNPDTGRKLKANILWSNLNYNDDVTGFRGLPAGRRTNTGVYNEIYNYGQWWTSTETSTTDAQRFYLDFGNNAIHPTTLNKNFTQSVRLIKDL